MTSESLIKSAKYGLGISQENTAFDAELQDYANDAVDRLFPIVQRELPEDETVTLAASAHQFTLPTGVVDIRSGGLFIKSSTDTTSEYQSYNEYSVHGSVVYLQQEFVVAQTVKILGLGRHTVATVPQEFKKGVVLRGLQEAIL